MKTTGVLTLAHTHWVNIRSSQNRDTDETKDYEDLV